MMKRLVFGLSLFISVLGYGQQDQLFSQYMINPSNFNPAYTGSRGVNTLFLQHRQQWLGLEGSPTQTYFNYQSSIESSRLGIGLNYVSDKIGVLDENELNCASSYIDLSQTFNDNLSSPGTVNGVFPIDGSSIDFTYEL